jgi:hypothetical protein
MTGHELLLRLAGRVPDRVLARARRALADGAARRAIAQLAMTVAQTPVPLTADELAAIRSLAGERAALPAVHPVEELPPLQFGFVDLDEYGEVGRDELDEALVAAVEAHRPEITCVWRAWRYSRLDHRRATGPAATHPLDARASQGTLASERSPADEDRAASGGPAGDPGATLPASHPSHSSPAYRVYVIEVENSGMIQELSADLLRAVPDSADAGVEIIPLSDEPFPYQDEALAESLLIWARDDTQLVVAPIADSENGPGLAPDHAVTDDLA